MIPVMPEHIENAEGFTRTGALAFDLGNRVKIAGYDLCDLIRQSHDEKQRQLPGGGERHFASAMIDFAIRFHDEVRA